MRVSAPQNPLCHTLCNARLGEKLTFLSVDYGGELSVKTMLFHLEQASMQALCFFTMTR